MMRGMNLERRTQIMNNLSLTAFSHQKRTQNTPPTLKSNGEMSRSELQMTCILPMPGLDGCRSEATSRAGCLEGSSCDGHIRPSMASGWSRLAAPC